MRTTLGSVVAATIAAILPIAAQGSDRQEAPAHDAVIAVPVWVRNGDRPVKGLAAGDFVLADNDIAQQVQVAAIESVAVNVTLVIDASSTSVIVDRLAKDLQQIAQVLRASDGLRVLRSDTGVEELRRMSPSGAAATIRAGPPQNGSSAVHDAIIAALVAPVNADRPHLVVAITDGVDTMSITTADRVREVASRSDAVLHIVALRPKPPAQSAVTFFRPRFLDSDIVILTEAAERTGGEVKRGGLFGNTDPVSAFKRAFDDFLQGYLLQYTPRGVEGGGWHELSVTLSALPNAAVSARKGRQGG